MTTLQFPKELLNQSAQERYQYFDKLLVIHPRFVEAHDAIWEALHKSSPPVLVNLFGPASAGKTTLLSWIKEQLLREALPGLLTDLGRIPFVMVNAIPPTKVTYDWNDFFIRSLSLLNEPLIEDKGYPVILTGNRRRSVRKYLALETIAPQLFQALEQSLRYRHVSTFIIDDAPYLGMMYGRERLVDHFRNIRRMTQRTGTIWFFVGTYNLLELMTKTDLAGWENINIHFPRYQVDSIEDYAAFQQILLTFQQHVPLPVEPDFVNQSGYFYSGCSGCIGTLKVWLSRSLAAALEDGSDTILLKHLEGCKYPSARLEKFVDEIERGEEALVEWNNSRASHLEKSQRQRKKQTKGSRGRVGQRKPVRDPVGE